MLVSDFDFYLPPELIAQHPPAERGAARMLHLRDGEFRDAYFRDFPELLRTGDLLVFNDTRVLPARLFGHRSGSRAQRLSPHNPASREFLHGRVEVLLTKRLPGAAPPLPKGSAPEEQLWQALVRPGRKIMPGERLYFYSKGGEQEGDAGGTGNAALPAAGAGCPTSAAVSRCGTTNPMDASRTHSDQDGAAGAGGYAATDAAPAAGAGPLLEAEVLARGEFGERTLRFLPVPDFFARLEALGHIPLPPYIDRPDSAEDRERYQTVFARESGSVAAPTAGLHFTPGILQRLAERGIETASVTLHVGLGTFAPIRTEQVEEHRIHTEWYQISEDAAGKIAQAKRQGRRVVAVGTTTVRTLEYAAGRAEESQKQSQGQRPHPSQQMARMGHPEQAGGPHLPVVGKCGEGETVEIAAQSGEANIFIYPGYRFRVVDAMLTNFHLPKSTLLMLVCAFAGREPVLAAYEHAVRERYRFFSYGDCMFLE